MKLLTILLAVATLTLGGLCVIQRHQLAQQKSQLIQMRAEAELSTNQIEALQAAQKSDQEQKRELLAHAGENAPTAPLVPVVAAQADAVAAAPASTNAEPAKADKTGLGGFLGKMMQDPDTKKFIRDQQRMMMDQMYGPLMKQLNLNTEDAAKFKDLLADGMMNSAEKATSLFGGASATNRAELMSSMAAEQKNLEEQVKTFLGEDRFATYKDYQQTVGERTQLNMFKQQNSASDYPVNDQQIEQLLTIMKQEKQGVTAALGQNAPGASPDQANLDAMLSEQQGEKLLTAQEAANQRVYERARTVLSPDQLGAFGKFQQNQLQMMRMGMSMARKFMAPDSAGATPPGQ